MISSDVMRGFNSLILLSILMKEDSYGYKISNTIKEITNDKYVMKETTLYSAFNRLEKSDLIQSYSSTETNGKPRTYYRITDLGRQTYHDKVTEWLDTKKVMDQFIKEE
ncbi:MAG: PadR family transcriptional regulator, regulatory protein PadR [Carnobacterium sp.]|uniref:PadR family transcriptional regulator n=1 Tax=Carnobacterium TaxID=2747 RepID=UPI000559A044|nr:MULTISPECIES: PadR family transcriptional regulator [Carnobacterium]MDN5372003.1 PadR family transcriptional regulator, regulatory protein PadR [Carnobacterium sp.]